MRETGLSIALADTTEAGRVSKEAVTNAPPTAAPAGVQERQVTPAPSPPLPLSTSSVSCLTTLLARMQDQINKGGRRTACFLPYLS